MHKKGKGFCAWPDMASLSGRRDPLCMVKKGSPRHFIRQWRKHRDLSLEQLAERLGMTHGNLSRIERGLVPYNQTMLEALARELRTDVASLLMRDPSDPDAIWSVWDSLAAVERRQVVEIAKTFKKTGTGNS